MVAHQSHHFQSNPVRPLRVQSASSESTKSRALIDRPGPARTAKQQASTEIHAAEGEKLTLTCTVADPGNPPSFTFVWRKDGTFLTRGPTHTINSVMDKHYGAYTCAPYNGAGEGDAASIMLTKKGQCGQKQI